MVSAIKIDNVHKHYGDVHALRGISLDVKQGEFFGLLGPNGAGKSTLISILAGLTSLTSGHVAVMGHDVVKQYRQSRRSLGIVPQELVYDPFFTVRELLEIQAGYFGKKKGASSEWIDRLLEGLKLTDKASANMRTLSGGMKRRVLIAQALVHKPEVVILDEPTAGVDVELRNSLWDFIQQLHQEGRTIVLTTHYLEEAEKLCDRIAIINEGQLIALDSTAALLARGVGKVRVMTLTLGQPLASIPACFQGQIKTLDALHVELRFDRDNDSIVSILDRLRDAGADVVDLRIEEPDLEDVFIEITRQA